MNAVNRTATEWLLLRFLGIGRVAADHSFARLVERYFGDDPAMCHVARIVNGAAAPDRFDVMPESAGLRALIEGLHAQRLPEATISERAAHFHDALLAEIRERIAAGSRLETNPLLDEASGLPNRFLFLDRLAQGIAFAHRHDTLLAVCSIRIDLSEVPTHVGKVAAELADRLHHTIRELDAVGRLGLDEFGVVVNDLRARAQGDIVAAKIALILNEPYDIGERAYSIPPRIGMSFYPAHGHDADMLLDGARRAATAGIPLAVFGE